MIVKVKDPFEKTRHVKNNDKFRKHILRGQRNAKYHERILSNEKKYQNNIICNFIISIFSKIVIDTELRNSA